MIQVKIVTPVQRLLRHQYLQQIASPTPERRALPAPTHRQLWRRPDSNRPATQMHSLIRASLRRAAAPILLTALLNVTRQLRRHRPVKLTGRTRLQSKKQRLSEVRGASYRSRRDFRAMKIARPRILLLRSFIGKQVIFQPHTPGQKMPSPCSRTTRRRTLLSPMWPNVSARRMKRWRNIPPIFSSILMATT